MHNPTNTFISFGLLIAAVGSSFAYVSFSITPDLGFSGVQLSPAAASALGIEEDEGILVTTVEPGGPADLAGLEGGTRAITIGERQILVGGDIIIAIDGSPVRTVEDLRAAMDPKSAGDSVRMTVIRDSEVRELNAVLERRS